MTILNQKRVILVNDETSMGNPNSNTGIYITAAKVAQNGLVDDNKREKEETKKENSKKDSHPKVAYSKKAI